MADPLPAAGTALLQRRLTWQPRLSNPGGREAGAAGYFRKPVDDQALLEAITNAVAHRSDIPQNRTSEQ